MNDLIAQSPAYPYDPRVGTYTVTHPRFPQPIEQVGWQDENLSWKEDAAIFAGLYPVVPVVTVSGPDAARLLSDATISGYGERFPAGRLKHTVLCDDLGRVLTHGMVVRLADDRFDTYSLSPWLDFAATKGDYDVSFENRTLTEFTHQCTGPRILEVLEHATGECLHDIPFMGHRTSTIAGHPVRLFRMGMAGTLGYEVHGHIDHAREVYAAIIEAGEPYRIQRVGWKSSAAQLCEGGFPQETFTFYGAASEDPGFYDYLRGLGYSPDVWPGTPVFTGSAGVDPGKRYRNPLELGRGRSLSLGHDFRGRAALERERENPTRRIVTLLWNEEDVLEIHASLYRQDEPPYQALTFPIDDVFLTSQAGIAQHQDDVLAGDVIVGASTGRVYSLQSRDMVSMGVVDVAHAELGTELVVLWGEPAARQKRVRATVAPYPHLALATNAEIDVATIPCIRDAA